MKQSEYIPISVRENVEDKNVAKIVDYFERNSNLEILIQWLPARDFLFKNNLIEINFNKNYFSITKDSETILRWKPKLLADNIVWIWGSLKHY